jgi:tetratricopeptide (TPR) repeat protein
MNKASSLWLVVLSSLLPACVSTPNDPVQPLVLMNSGIQINPDSEYLRGKLLHLQGRYDEAQQAYLSVLTMDKNHAAARNGLAALLGARGDLDRSIALLNSMAQSDTRLPQVYINLGHAWTKKGQLVQARAALERALELDPNNLAAKEKMAVLLSLEKPVLAGATQTIVAADTNAAVISVNPVERLSDGLYVLRYSVPAPESVPQTVQKPADAVLKSKASNATESIVEVTAPNNRSDSYKDSELQRVLPTLAIELNSEVKNVNKPAVEVAGTSTRADFSKGSESQSVISTIAIEVANGNGVQGLARALRGLLNGQSWRVVRTINHEQFGVRFTRIEYAPNSAQDAQNLADTLGINAIFRLNNQQTGTQMRIILGHDLKDLSAIRQRLAVAAHTTRTSSAIPAKSDKGHVVN